jgi:hypothetical protein
VTLFPATITKPKSPRRDKRPRHRIPTGAPRLVESSTDRASRASSEAWASLIEAVRRSASARLGLLEGRPDGDRITCPWEHLTGCDVSCRCRGAGTVTAKFLRDHYDRLALEIVRIASPRRSS